ncbi:hypothetical protein CASFOL_011677 [Castilleja foliolosa]|uniref:Uncharacterized protein n=1 Tax=Castilleja foliolosa TaxID=1961234 RepID=A0ABD3DWR3_9LAMI
MSQTLPSADFSVEVFVNPTRDESLIFELLDLKTDVADHGSATWFLQDLANEQDAEGTMVLEQSGVFEAGGLRLRNNPAIINTAVGQMAISNGRQGREAQNLVKVWNSMHKPSPLGHNNARRARMALELPGIAPFEPFEPSPS